MNAPLALDYCTFEVPLSEGRRNAAGLTSESGIFFVLFAIPATLMWVGLCTLDGVRSPFVPGMTGHFLQFLMALYLLSHLALGAIYLVGSAKICLPQARWEGILARCAWGHIGILILVTAGMLMCGHPVWMLGVATHVCLVSWLLKLIRCVYEVEAESKLGIVSGNVE